MLVYHVDLESVIYRQRKLQIFRPTVAVLLYAVDFHNRPVALGLVRSHKSEDGAFTPLQGGIKRRETVWQAATRELHEELGLHPREVQMGAYLGSFENRLPPERCKHGAYFGKEIHFVSAFVDRMNIRPANAENKEFSWFFEANVLFSILALARPEKCAATIEAFTHSRTFRSRI